ncbi:MAG: RnfABCDGE type electron transport complex subunit G [Clostridiales bacterium]|nr:RnfABCDGE type electron transport complex subunit G [Clostridiales bacterium]
MKKILKLTLILFLISAIVAGVLGVVNEVTKDRIEEQKQIKTAKAYAAVLPSEGYEELELDLSAYSNIDSISKATGGEGYVVKTSFSGAQGNITMVVGVDNDYKCTGISIISHAETSGLGANAASTSDVGVTWRAQFVGQDKNMAITKAGGTIDALTGATITSRSVAEAAANAISVVESLG